MQAAKPRSRSRPAPEKKLSKRGWIKRILVWTGALLLGLYFLVALMVLGLRWINPPTTAVQTQRRVEAMFAKKGYKKQYRFVPMSRISRDLQHAVVAAEDTRFREHAGIDWEELRKLVDDDLKKGKLGRGGSTITQQLVKNLFLTTKRSLVKKGLEFMIVPLAELFLSKDRILELYLNVIEWGPGVYGAEAASQYHYRKAASQVVREEAARLAAVIPNPLRRKPDRMDGYSEIILIRMQQMGW